MTTLVYIRRNKIFNADVLKFAKTEFPESDIYTISEYSGSNYKINVNIDDWDDCDIVDSFIKENLNLESIIFRDRVLRNTTFKNSYRLIRRVVGNLLQIWKRCKYTRVVSYPVDNYVTDILAQISNHYDVKFYGVSNFFISGYKRITIYGEYSEYRKADEREIQSVYSLLQDNFKSHMVPSKLKALYDALIRYFKYKGRYIIFYLILHKTLRRYEYDFLATPYNATVRKIYNFFLFGIFTKLSQINFSKNSVLLPLHYFPEATIEYWSNDTSCIEFEDSLFVKLKKLNQVFDQVIVKEHPAMVFNSGRKFYERIKSYKNVTLIDPFIPTHYLLDYVSCVACWTGSSGIEAYLNKIPILPLSDSYYLDIAKKYSKTSTSNQLQIIESNEKPFLREILNNTVVFK